ncbi:MAG: hypothetical protein CMN32_09680 [Saprospirales bacterium]|nr:hypothetical protein [Saprospirales bacterium]
MRIFLTGFTVFLIFTVFARWYFVCELRHHCEEKPVVVAGANTLALYDGDKPILQGFEQFNFPYRSFRPSLSSSNEEFIEKAAGWLEENPGKNITITGRFLDTEAKARSGIFENLGIARASAVENLLIKAGVDADRITIDYEMVEGNELVEPVSFGLYTPQTEAPGKLEKLQFSFEDNTFSDANFEYNSDEFNPGEQCRLYADSVKNYLGQHPELMLEIIGHTDSIGGESYNYELGLRRAQKAAEYFRKLGVKSTISVASKGETAPMAPNSKPDGTDNPAGRQKNRRVNFKIVKKEGG